MFYGDFQDKNDLCSRFGINDSVLKGCKILYAQYDCVDYDGKALVVFRKNRKLYEVNGSHCSCYGLEGQWEPELTSVRALRHRLENGTLGSYLGIYEKEFKAVLEGLRPRKRPSCDHSRTP